MSDIQSATDAVQKASETLPMPAAAEPGELRRRSSEQHEPRRRERNTTKDSLMFLHGTNNRLLVVMVGLPGRGKTYIAKRINRYLKWIGYSSFAINIGNYRRELCGADRDASFFDPCDEEHKKARLQSARLAMNDVFARFQEGSEVGILDGTNSTIERRNHLHEWTEDFERTSGVKVRIVFVESICEDPEMLSVNAKSKLTSPDYKNMQQDKAIADFQQRIAQYEKAYSKLGSREEESKYSYIQLINGGKKLVTNKMKGYLMGRLVFFLMNIRISRQTIVFTRHGESQFNVLDKIGGDSDLSPQGRSYADKLSGYIQKEFKDCDKFCLWTSTLQRTIQTAEPLYNSNMQSKIELIRHNELQEISVGVCDGFSYKDVELKYPDEFASRARDKLRYRYPQGESYEDVIKRLEPIIFELERTTCPMVVVCHRAVLRCLLAYFLDNTQQEVPYLDVPLHTILKMTPASWSNTLERIPLDVPLDEQTAPSSSSQPAKS